MNANLPSSQDLGEFLWDLAEDVVENRDGIAALKGFGRAVVQWSLQMFMDFASKTAAQIAASSTPIIGFALGMGMNILNSFLTYATSSAPKVW
jgi:hypothetical protein